MNILVNIPVTRRSSCVNKTYCLPHSKYLLCCSVSQGLVPTLASGYLPWLGYLPGQGVPTLTWGTYLGWGYLPWMGYLPWTGGTYPDPGQGVPTLAGGCLPKVVMSLYTKASLHQGRYPPARVGPPIQGKYPPNQGRYPHPR